MVVGIDASKPYLDGAHRLRSQPDVTHEFGDARHMTYPDASFDACVSTSFRRWITSRFDGPSGIGQFVKALAAKTRAEIERHVRAGYLAGMPDGPRSFAAIVRGAGRGAAPAINAKRPPFL